MTMSKIVRKKIFVDKSRIWNLEEPADGAAPNIHVERILNTSENSKNLDTARINEKNIFLRTISSYLDDSPR